VSDFSSELLQSTHKGVHEQFDLLAAAMQTQSLLQSEIFYSQIERASQKEIKSWIKEKSIQNMKELGHSPGFLQKRLLVYVYKLYEYFYGQYTSVLQFKEGTSLDEIQYSILILAAAFLDNQFSEKGLADICGFLKQDMGALSSLMQE
jgi:hypothetical protein